MIAVSVLCSIVSAHRWQMLAVRPVHRLELFNPTRLVLSWVYFTVRPVHFWAHFADVTLVGVSLLSLQNLQLTINLWNKLMSDSIWKWLNGEPFIQLKWPLDKLHNLKILICKCSFCSVCSGLDHWFSSPTFFDWGSFQAQASLCTHLLAVATCTYDFRDLDIDRMVGVFHEERNVMLGVVTVCASLCVCVCVWMW